MTRRYTDDALEHVKLTLTKFRLVTNEAIRRAECQDLADSLKDLRVEVDENLEGINKLWLVDLDKVINWLEKISSGDNPNDVILTPEPKLRGLRNRVIIQNVNWLRSHHNISRRAAERRIARFFEMHAGAVRQIINRDEKTN